MDLPPGETKWVTRGHNDGRCYYEENASLPVEEMAPDDVAIITQIGFNEWYASATEKEKKKVFKRVKRRHKMGWRIPQIWHDRSCINKSTTDDFNKDAAIEAEKIIKKYGEPKGFPTFYLVNSDGSLRDSWSGYSKTFFLNKVEKLLNLQN